VVLHQFKINVVVFVKMVEQFLNGLLHGEANTSPYASGVEEVFAYIGIDSATHMHKLRS
jgi:hypothetical protein